jgi:flagellar hook-associated protein 1 FlgK
MTITNNALSGALAAQLALSATSQNIANLQTKGYTRQAALLVAQGNGASGQSAGNGVAVTQLMRFSDGYKNQQMWRAASNVGQHSQSQPYLTQLERVMGDDSASLSAGLDKFFGALNAVAGVDPTSTALRNQVLTAAGLVAQRFNNLNNVFNSQVQSVVQQRSAIIDAANSAIADIASLNQKISHAAATGASASALIDARDQAIDKLASQMALEVSDQPDGTRNVSLATGESLVIGGVGGKLSATGGVSSAQSFSLTFAASTFSLNASSLRGQLGGLTDYETNILQPLQKSIEDIAGALSSKVNATLAAGYTMSGATPGKPLFVFTPGTSSNMLQVAPGFTTADLAFSADGNPGDIGALQKLLDIKNQAISVNTLGTVLLGDADTQLVGKLGVDSQQNQSSLATAETVRTQATQDWQSTSGVNQDEEASNLLEYQKMYQANMKVLAVANALFDATLDMMG